MHISGCLQAIIYTYPYSGTTETRTAWDCGTKTFGFTMEVDKPGGPSEAYVTLAELNSDGFSTWLGSRLLVRP
ncbi:hypothetical protein [Streptomyces glaucescens]|uniref:hypothetical protein n=1 Tax=Streptomyces glaucescens TaxID=1907 RepID=UPI000A399EB4|nr:hypothetical protein [Streptomyces glaucescens]